jgi:hypothetical protein
MPLYAVKAKVSDGWLWAEWDDRGTAIVHRTREGAERALERLWRTTRQTLVIVELTYDPEHLVHRD